MGIKTAIDNLTTAIKTDIASFLLENILPKIQSVEVVSPTEGTLTVSAGAHSIASATEPGKASAGQGGEIRIRYWDDKAGRYRTTIGYIGEDGLEPDTLYCLNDDHQFVRAQI